MIEISAEYGDSLASDAFWPMHYRLNEIFSAQMRTDYATKVTLLAIILRVSGLGRDYGSEGPERLFYRRKGGYLEIDLVIPRSAWEERPLSDVRYYLVRGLRACFLEMKERLIKVDRGCDFNQWQQDFERCLAQFESEDGANEIPRKFVSAKGRAMYRHRMERQNGQDPIDSAGHSVKNKETQ